MDATHTAINQMLVTLFNHILRIEEQALSFPGLSIREVHVIEAVCEAPDSRMSALAARLRVTRGSLSVAVTTLERKGYLLRSRRTDDRRVIDLLPTAKALEIQRKHKAFHEEMVAAVTRPLSDTDLQVLTRALHSVDSYFTSKEEPQP